MSIPLNNNDEFEKFVRSQKRIVGFRKNYDSRTTQLYCEDGSILDINATIHELWQMPFDLVWSTSSEYATTADDRALFEQMHPSSDKRYPSPKWKNVRKLYWYRYLKDKYKKSKI